MTTDPNQNPSRVPEPGCAPPSSGVVRFTVVTACRNAAATLDRTLESIDAQRTDGVELEHIVLDAESTDETPEILRCHAAPWRTVVVGRDAGPADAINHGFARATGDILAWLNADDLYAPGALARVAVAFQRRPRTAAVFGRCPVVDAEDREIRRPITWFKELWHPISCRFLIQSLNYVCQPALFFRRDAWAAAGPLRLDYRAAWDYDFLLRLWRQGPVRRLGGAPLAFFRWTPGSISGANFERQFDEELAIAKADAGAWSPQAVFHRAMRFGIVAIDRRMALRASGAKRP